MPVKIAKNQPNIVEQLINNHPKYLKNTFKKRWKINPKSIKNPPKIDQKSTKNRSWRPLGASWGVLNVLGASWGRLGGLLGRLGGLLGASWWPTWLQVDPQKGAKIDQKSKQKSINFSMPLGIWFLQDFGGFWEEHGGKLASKIEPKTMLSSKGDFLNKSLVFP